MKKLSLTLLCLVLFIGISYAQGQRPQRQRGSLKQQVQNKQKMNYDEFVKDANKKYEEFRDSVNKKYAEFMEKAWKDYPIEDAVDRPKEDQIKPIEYDKMTDEDYLEEMKREEAEKKLAEEQKKREEEQARLAVEQKKQEEEQARLAAEKKAQEEEFARLAAEKKAQEEELARIAAEKKKQEENLARIAAEKKKQEEEIARIVAEKKQQEEKQAKLAEKKKKQEEEQARLAAEKKAREEEQARLAAEKKAQQEEKARMLAEKKKQEEEKARILAEQKKIREEQKRIADEKKKQEEKQKQLEKEQKEAELKKLLAEKKKKEEEERQLALKQKEQERKQQLMEEELRKQEEKQRKMEEKQRQQEEKQRQLEEKRKQQEEKARLLAEQKKQQEEEQARLAAEKKKQEEEQARIAAEKKKQEEEQARIAAEQKKQEEQQRQLAEKQRKQEEKARQLAEKKKQQEEQARLMAEKKKKQEEQARLLAEKKKQQEEQQRLLAEQKKKQQEKQSKPIEAVVVPVVLEVKPQPKPQQPIIENKESMETSDFMFYGTNMKVRWGNAKQFKLKGTDKKSLSEAFMELTSKGYTNLVHDCLELRKEYKLCDWAYYKMLQTISELTCGKGTNEAIFMQGVLLNQSGYQIRFALEENTKLHIMSRMDGFPYDRGYLTADGKLFFLMDNCKAKNMSVCDAAYPGEQMMSLGIAEQPELKKNLSDNRTVISRFVNVKADMQMNKNLMDFYNDYPTSYDGKDMMTRWAYYANTPVSQEVKDKVYPQLKQQIGNAPKLMAANMLLNWVQMGLTYGYDEKVWGHDRAFFAEESLFYPFCDCEDRSILFSHLIRDLLDLDVVLVYYPGHLYTAVCFNEDVTGDYIMVNGRKFTVADPTYYNANVGKTMSKMDNSKAKVILLKR
ncbi:hypothetical protein SAMN05216463_10224 [Xylanibacter ruminicola]|uniref:Uncharacterized protein n=2 Tax=Xylanibacter ruminicola TaxID=839 RepID=A0A1M6RMJ9_XYLRU|nr:hypothetical protein SAMN05216463_10224 [Xylanibacter ruminicola]